MGKRLGRIAAVVIALMVVPITWGEVKMASVFSSHMVLQQQKPIVIWGSSEAGEKLTVKLGDETAQTTADASGKWSVALPAMMAGGPHTLTVTGSNTIKLDDVLIGEVWICSGQSNMEMAVRGVTKGNEEIAAANYPNIRLFLVPKTSSATPQGNVYARWALCIPQALAQGFSAAGYFFGRELNKQLNVPIGLIASSYGGTRIEPWTPLEAFNDTPSLKNIHDQMLQYDPRSDLYKTNAQQYLAAMSQWMDKARQAIQQGIAIPARPPMPLTLEFPQNPQTPTGLYNGMIHPLVPLSIRGVIWYQGESNRDEGMAYVDKMKALITGWRSVFNQPDFPFYYVQIAPHMYGNEPAEMLPAFWEAQAAVMKEVPNTGMAATIDIGEIPDIHPRNKQEVGRRLALWALAKTYNKSGLVYSGPTFKSMQAEGSSLRISFDHVGGGLVSRDGKPLTYFEIIDEKGGKFVPATARIDGADVVLSAEGVSNPVAMRFAWSKIAQPNLSNKEGLPAGPFRAGKAPGSGR